MIINPLRGLVPVISYLALTTFTSTAFAKMDLNAMCVIEPKSKVEEAIPYNPSKDDQKSLKIPKVNSVSDDDVTTKYPIASLSKIVTTGWALAKLGPEYRFTTRFTIIPNSSQKTCALHIGGDMDPFFGKDYLSFIIKDLQALVGSGKPCQELTQITYDEFFRYSATVMDHHSRRRLSWRNPGGFGASTLTGLQAAFGKIKGMDKAQIIPVPKAQMTPYIAMSAHWDYATQSAPLYLYLKEMNKYSHNYAANVLFEKLGGPEEFKKFAKDKFDFDETDLTMLNGSGYPINGIYNSASCESVVSILSSMSDKLDSYQGSRTFGLKDVLAVAGRETYSTFNDSFGDYRSEMVAKTGTANPVISFAGMVKTDAGPLYFAILTKTKNRSDQRQARSLISKLMSSIKSHFEVERFEYDTLADLVPFQKDSHLFSYSTANIASLK